MTDPSDSTPLETPAPNPGAFLTTRWTRVLAARGESPEARAALSDLCAAYWTPVFRFLLREGRDDDTARELTQEFFARLLARNSLATATPERGRFRSFVIGALKHFLADSRLYEQRLKRGGGSVTVPLHAGTDTSPGLDPPAPDEPAPELFFDRHWALTVMDRALATLASEAATAARLDHFEALRPWLGGESTTESQADVAHRLGIGEGALKVAVHRLRRRFREVVRHEIAQTVPVDADIGAELRYLVDVLAQG